MATCKTMKIHGAETTVFFRLANPEDKDQVLAIDTDALDYLGAYYDHYMSRSERFTGFVAVIDDKVVSFQMWQLINDGEAAVRMAGRTVTTLQHHGIMMSLRSYAKEYMREHYPRCIPTTYGTVAAYYGAYIDFGNQFKLGTVCSLLMTRDCVHFHFPMSQLESCLSKAALRFPTSSVCLANSAASCADVIRRSHCRVFFPADVCVVHFEPYPIEPVSNLLYVFSQEGVALSYKVGAHNHASIAQRTQDNPTPVDKSITRMDSYEDVVNIAISKIFRCPVGVSLGVDAYGCDVDDMLAHMFFHIARNISLLQTHGRDTLRVSLYSLVSKPLYIATETLKSEYGFTVDHMEQQLVYNMRSAAALHATDRLLSNL